MNGKKILAVACSLSLFGAGTARADVVSDLQAQMEVLQKQDITAWRKSFLDALAA